MTTLPNAETPHAESRSVDHLVLPVADLARARARLAALGFVVAPDAYHPFGTSNCCVFLADGIYLEPLAVASREDCQTAIAAANMFVARDQAFRFRRGQNGLSAVVFKSEDAQADDASFHAAALSGGPMLSFSRPFVQKDGSSVLGSFHLAFAADLRAPDFFFFACQRLNAAAFPAAPNHPNGVLGLKAIVLAEENPSDFQYTVETLLNERNVRAHSFGIDIAARNTLLSILTPVGIAAHYGITIAPGERGLTGAGLVFSVASLAATSKCLVDSGVDFVRQASRLIVPAADGQGAFMAFEEQQPEDRQ